VCELALDLCRPLPGAPVMRGGNDGRRVDAFLKDVQELEGISLTAIRDGVRSYADPGRGAENCSEHRQAARLAEQASNLGAAAPGEILPQGLIPAQCPARAVPQSGG
jgi:hypothetical protein